MKTVISSDKNQANYGVIGTTEFAVFPENSDMPVPVKVDTGADGSSVWATEVNEQDGELSFVLFGPSSACYTGKVFTTRSFRLAKIKNSFGDDEFRYRVKLALVIAGKQYRASFTLANRANNRFPVLIGKRFLRNRFLVDVSLHNVNTPVIPSQNSVILLTSRSDEATTNLVKDMNSSDGATIELCHYQDLTYEITAEGKPRILLPSGEDIAAHPLVYFKAYRRYPDHAVAIAKYLQYRHVRFIDYEVGNALSSTKLSEMFMLAIGGVLVPPTCLNMDGFRSISYEQLADKLGPEIVLKDPASDRGKNNYVVSNAVEFAHAVKRLEHIQTVLVQKFIPNNGFYRVLCFGDEIVQVVHRTTSGHKNALKRHLNKPYGSSNATLIPVESANAEMISLALKAALTMGRNIAGVDLIQDMNTGIWYIIEVNYNPEMLGGIDAKAKQQALSKYLTREGASQ